MEVPEKRLDPGTPKLLEETPPSYCQPCLCDGKRLPVEGYCETCREYLCKECFNIHTKPSPLRHHVLLDKSSIPKQSPTGGVSSKKSSIVTIRCPYHTEKLAEFLCPSHDSIVCEVCVVLKHKTCAVEYIPDSKFARNYMDSEEYRGIIDSPDKLDSGIAACIGDVSENVMSVEERTTMALTDIQSFRKEINTFLDRQEQELSDVFSVMQNEDQTVLLDIGHNLKLLKTEVEESKDKLLSQENGNDLFVVSKQVIERLVMLQKSLKECIEKNQLPHYKFRPNGSVKKLLSSKETFGSVYRTYKAKSFKVQDHLTSCKKSTPNVNTAKTKLPDLNVKASNDKQSVGISGLALIQPNTLLVVDWNNIAVKAVDTGTNTVKAQLSMPGNPCDITVLQESQAAVTVPRREQIQVLSVSANNLCVVRSIAVSGHCFGICSTAQILVVTYTRPGKVEVMDHTGTVLNTINTDMNGESLFKEPINVCISMEQSENVIYVSDRITNKITKLAMRGEIRLTHTRETIFGLTCLEDGQLLLCNNAENTVELMNQDGSVVIPFIQKSHGIEKPRAICYCEEDGLLFISSNICDRSISIFQLENA